MDGRNDFILLNLGLALLLVVLFPVVFSFGGSTVLSAAVPMIFAVGAGYLFSRIFRYYGNLELIASGVVGSVVLAGTTGLQNVVYQSLGAVNQASSSIVETPSYIVNTGSTVNPDLIFTILFLSFNAPIIYPLIKENKLEPKYLLLYLLPVVIYLSIPIVLGGIL